MPINKNEITKEMLKQALECKTAEDLIAFAKTEGGKTVNSNILREERRRVAVIKVSLQNPAIEDSMANCNFVQ